MHVRQTDIVCLENTTKDCGTDMPNVIASNDLFDFDEWIGQETKKPPEPLVFKTDPVAASLASYRLWTLGGPRWADLESVALERQDHEQAAQLKTYYARSMTMDALKGQGLKTTFRQKLYAIATNCHTYTKEDIGLLHRLAYFYHEDLELDQLVEQFSSDNTPKPPFELAGEFGLHQRTLRSRRSGDYYHYWLRRKTDDFLYKLVVKMDDPMRSLVESLLTQPRTYTAKAYSKGMQGRRKFNYLQLGDLRLV